MKQFFVVFSMYFLLLITAVFISYGFGQKSNKKQQAGPLEITAVDIGYQRWQYQDASITGWGVRVHLVNTTDSEVTEYIGPVGLQITNALGKRYSLPDAFLSIFVKINLGQLYSQKMKGNLIVFGTGNATEISDSSTAVGTLVCMWAKNECNLNLRLSPRKSVTLVFVFDSPAESKPQTLSWPKTKPIDLR